MGGTCSTSGKKTKTYVLLAGKLEGNTALGRLRRRWLDNIKMDPGGRGREDGGFDWIGLAQYRDMWRALVNTVMNL
jgi:hypothetical protein